MKRLSLIILTCIPFFACNPTPEEPLATIGIVTDIHYYRDREPGGSRYYALSKVKLSEAVDVFNKQGVDFAVSLGDTFDPDPDTYQDIADESHQSGIIHLMNGAPRLAYQKFEPDSRI